MTPDSDLNDRKMASIKTKIETNKNFTLLGALKVSYNAHLGWETEPEVNSIY